MKKLLLLITIVIGTLYANIVTAQWLQTNGPYGGDIYCFAVSGNGNIFTGTYGAGVFLSSNNGSSWTAVNTGLTDTFVWSLAISGTNIFAGTGGNGVWKRALSDITVGVKEINNNESNIAVYPNPATNNITIESPQQPIFVHYAEILNIQGQLIKSFASSSNKTSVDISTFPNGMYFVKMKTEKGIAMKKFVKE
ncbi:MAG: T9SS type A sorting domain-containing protein [Bacteroidales bacterium]